MKKDNAKNAKNTMELSLIIPATTYLTAHTSMKKASVNDAKNSMCSHQMEPVNLMKNVLISIMTVTA